MTNKIPAWVHGQLTPMDKLEVHERGLKHRAVSVFVMDGQNVLIQRRSMSKYHTPGLWANTVCTHPNWNEKSSDCAVRRLREELGITGLYPALRGTVEYRADVGDGLVENEVVDIFLAHTNKQIPVRPNSEEVMQVEWIGIYDLAAEVSRRPARFTPWLRIYMEQHKDRIFGNLARI